MKSADKIKLVLFIILSSVLLIAMFGLTVLMFIGSVPTIVDKKEIYVMDEMNIELDKGFSQSKTNDNEWVLQYEEVDIFVEKEEFTKLSEKYPDCEDWTVYKYASIFIERNDMDATANKNNKYANFSYIEETSAEGYFINFYALKSENAFWNIQVSVPFDSNVPYESIGVWLDSIKFESQSQPNDSVDPNKPQIDTTDLIKLSDSIFEDYKVNPNLFLTGEIAIINPIDEINKYNRNNYLANIGNSGNYLMFDFYNKDQMFFTGAAAKLVQDDICGTINNVYVTNKWVFISYIDTVNYNSCKSENTFTKSSNTYLFAINKFDGKIYSMANYSKFTVESDTVISSGGGYLKLYVEAGQLKFKDIVEYKLAKISSVNEDAYGNIYLVNNTYDTVTDDNIVYTTSMVAIDQNGNMYQIYVVKSEEGFLDSINYKIYKYSKTATLSIVKYADSSIKLMCGSRLIYLNENYMIITNPWYFIICKTYDDGLYVPIGNNYAYEIGVNLTKHKFVVFANNDYICFYNSDKIVVCYDLSTFRYSYANNIGDKIVLNQIGELECINVNNYNRFMATPIINNLNGEGVDSYHEMRVVFDEIKYIKVDKSACKYIVKVKVNN